MKKKLRKNKERMTKGSKKVRLEKDEKRTINGRINGTRKVRNLAVNRVVK